MTSNENLNNCECISSELKTDEHNTHQNQNDQSQIANNNEVVQLNIAEQDITKSSVTPTFDDLIPSITIKESIKKLGFLNPTYVQTQTIPQVLHGNDIIVQAQTGSGKTLAFLLPLLNKLEDAQKSKPVNYTYALIITPTRELAYQIHEVFKTLASDISPQCLIGGAGIEQQKKCLSKDRRVVIGTPGRILDLLKQRELRLNKCKYFVLDEADEMLSMGFLEDVRGILSRLPDKRQGVFCSATITPRVDMLANSFLSKAITIIGDKEGSELPDIEHDYCEVGGGVLSKSDALCDIIETFRPRSAVIFCNTRSDTQLVEALLRRRGFDARRINSDLTQSQRNKIMKKIRAGELQFLVATDIAARGLDIEHISLVVNYSIHEQAETYIHRTGRTGRAGRNGRAISLVGPRDFEAFHSLKKCQNIAFKKLELPSDREVCSARLAHLYEIMRSYKADLSKRDLILARKLTTELSTEDKELNKELETMIAKFCRYVLEHHVSHESKTLDETLDEESPDEENEPIRSNSRGKSPRDNYKDDYNRESSTRRKSDHKDAPHREHREKRQDERHGHRDTTRRQDEYNKRDDYNKRDESNKNDRYSKNDKQQNNRRHSSDSRHEDSRRNYKSNTPQETHPQEIRLYIGQGTSHGMSPKLFIDLATSIGEIKDSDIERLTIREKYGYVDIFEPSATRLLNALNGIEYNGQVLPVERAAVLSATRRE